jgi:hypothetical protein
MIKPYHTIWLLESEASMWDERGLVAAWLGAHGRVTDRQEFRLVTLSRYELNAEQTSDTLFVRPARTVCVQFSKTSKVSAVCGPNRPGIATVS